jgi:hypothetical protein
MAWPGSIKPGQQLFDILGPPQIGWQHRRGEPNGRRITGTSIANSWPLYLDRAYARLDPTLRRMTVANDPFATLVVNQIGMALDEGVDLSLDGLHQHPSRSFPQNTEQRIIFDNPTWSRQTNNITLIHGVSFQTVTSTITKDTPPNYAYTKLSFNPHPHSGGSYQGKSASTRQIEKGCAGVYWLGRRVFKSQIHRMKCKWEYQLREALGPSSDDRRLALRCKASTVVGLVRKTGLVTPVDLRLSRFCPLSDRRIAALEPGLNLRFAAFGGAAHRMLRAKAQRFS